MAPCVEHRIRVGSLEIHLQCNLLSCLFGFALFTNSIQIAIGPLCAMVAISHDD